METIYSTTNQFVIFRLESQLYGIDIQSVQIIERIKNIMRVPKTPQWVKGVLNLRGEIIPVLDLSTLFDLNVKNYDEDTRIIIVKIEDTMVGLIVDSVKEVVELENAEIELVQNIQGKMNNNYIQGVGKVQSEEAIVTLLNLKNIIDEAFLIQK